jgi:hypothetical protein
VTWREWPLISLYLDLSWEHHLLASYLHEKTIWEGQHDQVGNLDFLAVEEWVI